MQSGIYRYFRNPNYSHLPAGERELLIQERNRVFGEKLKNMFDEMGPTFVKLGQMLSTRHDIFPEEIIASLEKLQDDVQPEPFSDSKLTLEEELRGGVDRIFASFDPTPVASGSIALAYRARLHSGEDVCVKVQRRGIAEIIRVDLEIIEKMLKFVEKRTDMGRIIDFDEVLTAFKDQLTFEMNFIIEKGNLETFRRYHKNDKYVRVPICYEAYTTRRVMTMEFIDQLPLKLIDKASFPVDKSEIARRILYSYANQVFRDGYFHGDPHPGNIMIEPDNQIVFLDFGIVGRLSKKNKYAMLKLFLGISKDSPRIVIDAILQMGAISPQINMPAFERDVQKLLDKYLNLTLHEVKLSELTNEFFYILYEYDIKVPGNLTMLAKTFIIMEGVVERLGLDHNILEIAQPIARKLVRNFVSRDYFTEFVVPNLYDVVQIAEQLPRTTLDFMRKFRDNGYKLEYVLEDSPAKKQESKMQSKRLSTAISLAGMGVLTAGMALSGALLTGDGQKIFFVIAGICGLFTLAMLVRLLRLSD